MKSKIVGEISALMVITSFSSGIVSAEGYKYEAEFICSSFSTLVPEHLLKKFESERGMNWQLNVKELELELCKKNLRHNMLVNNERLVAEQIKKIEEINKETEKIKKDRDKNRREIEKFVIENNLKDLIPFFPWTSMEKIEKIISAKEPNFFNVGSLFLDTEFLNAYFEGAEPEIKTTEMNRMCNEYKKYAARILQLKRKLLVAREYNYDINIKKLAALWVAKNILEKEMIMMKDLFVTQEKSDFDIVLDWFLHRFLYNFR